MGELISLAEQRPHISGNALCLECDDQWLAVAPVGTVELECPSCSTWKGVFAGMTAPETVLACDCGNQHFYITETSAICAKCGTNIGGWF